MMIRKRANQGMILNLDGMDGMRISNVTYCKLNKRLKTLHFFERKKNSQNFKKLTIWGGGGGDDYSEPEST